MKYSSCHTKRCIINNYLHWFYEYLEMFICPIHATNPYGCMSVERIISSCSAEELCMLAHNFEFAQKVSEQTHNLNMFTLLLYYHSLMSLFMCLVSNTLKRISNWPLYNI